MAALRRLTPGRLIVPRFYSVPVCVALLPSHLNRDFATWALSHKRPSRSATPTPTAQLRQHQQSSYICSIPACQPVQPRLSSSTSTASNCSEPFRFRLSGPMCFWHILLHTPVDATSEIIASTGDHTGSAPLGDRTLDVRTANSSGA